MQLELTHFSGTKYIARVYGEGASALLYSITTAVVSEIEGGAKAILGNKRERQALQAAVERANQPKAEPESERGGNQATAKQTKYIKTLKARLIEDHVAPEEAKAVGDPERMTKAQASRAINFLKTMMD